jgi:hypothetical protein
VYIIHKRIRCRLQCTNIIFQYITRSYHQRNIIYIATSISSTHLIDARLKVVFRAHRTQHAYNSNIHMYRYNRQRGNRISVIALGNIDETDFDVRYVIIMTAYKHINIYVHIRTGCRSYMWRA